MHYYQVLLEGSDIDIPIGDARAAGFFVTRIVRAATAEAAAAEAARRVAAEWATGPRSPWQASPRIEVAEVEPIGWLRGLVARQPGYVFHRDS